MINFGSVKYGISDLNTSNLDDVAVKAALNNLFSFRPRTKNFIANVW
jgi:hypothetical protein